MSYTVEDYFSDCGFSIRKGPDGLAQFIRDEDGAVVFSEDSDHNQGYDLAMMAFLSGRSEGQGCGQKCAKMTCDRTCSLPRGHYGDHSCPGPSASSASRRA